MINRNHSRSKAVNGYKKTTQSLITLQPARRALEKQLVRPVLERGSCAVGVVLATGRRRVAVIFRTRSEADTVRACGLRTDGAAASVTWIDGRVHAAALFDGAVLASSSGRNLIRTREVTSVNAVHLANRLLVEGANQHPMHVELATRFSAAGVVGHAGATAPVPIRDGMVHLELSPGQLIRIDARDDTAVPGAPASLIVPGAAPAHFQCTFLPRVQATKFATPFPGTPGIWQLRIQVSAVGGAGGMVRLDAGGGEATAWLAPDQARVVAIDACSLAHGDPVTVSWSAAAGGQLRLDSAKAQRALGVNLVANGSFEDVVDGVPVGCRPGTITEGAQCRIETGANVFAGRDARDGQRCVKVIQSSERSATVVGEKLSRKSRINNAEAEVMMYFPARSTMCVVLSLGCLTVAAAGEYPGGSQCASCHAGIEWIREPDTGMMKRILALGKARGDPAGCIVCHGGDPKATKAEAAHAGPGFYADPSSPWINEKTCGQCHPRHVKTQWTSLMMTEAGKIQGTTWAFGGLEGGYAHKWGNYDVHNPKDPAARIGTDLYRAYMVTLRPKEPQVYPDSLSELPPAPTDLARLKAHPEEAAYTYIRDQCDRCHWAVQGRRTRGDFRGMGCSACHIPYSTDGYYEGSDRTIPKDKPGHMLVHSIQATRGAKVTVHGKSYTGIPIATCTVCHNRGKRVGVSCQGLMESPYESPYTEGGGGQLPLHTKHYIAMQPDVHVQKGMLCQDCHTSNDVHSDGFLACSNLASIEIECSDCHGTPRAYPWELPLGYMDEFDDKPKAGPPRGTAKALYSPLEQGTVNPVEDGYLLTTRGNPMPGAVRRGSLVIVHTAAGKDLQLRPLKLLLKENSLSTEAKVAMSTVTPHMNKMECYACHDTWAPQCYGCHVKLDYSGGKTGFDWTEAGHIHERTDRNGAGEQGYKCIIPGKTTEQRSYLRWEQPILGVNGEGRVTPIIPGCQVSVTVIDSDGKDVIRNKIFRTAPGEEGSGSEGQLTLDMSPAHTHTVQKQARTCESCHVSEKTLGYGIDGGRLMRAWDKPEYAELSTADGKLLPNHARPQVEPIAGLTDDWSRVVTESGRQLMTVGSHFTRSRPLNNAERADMSRKGICLSCHQEIPAASVPVSVLHHVGQMAGMLPRTPTEHAALVHKVLLTSAWAQVGLAIVTLCGALGFIFLLAVRLKRRRRRALQTIQSPSQRGPGTDAEGGRTV